VARWIRGLWIVGIALVVVPVVIAGIVSWPPTVSVWGTIDGWVAGLPTAGALLIAALAYRSRVAQQRVARLDDLKAQARLVNAWAYVPSDADVATYGLKVSNRSDAPAYDLRIVMETPHGITMVTDIARVVPPGETLDLRRVAITNEPIETWNPLVPLVAVRFRDANGRLWGRYAIGELEEVTPGEDSIWDGGTMRGMSLRPPANHPFGHHDDDAEIVRMELVDDGASDEAASSERAEDDRAEPAAT
jgi:hypothetical protein